MFQRPGYPPRWAGWIARADVGWPSFPVQYCRHVWFGNLQCCRSEAEEEREHSVFWLHLLHGPWFTCVWDAGYIIMIAILCKCSEVQMFLLCQDAQQHLSNHHPDRVSCRKVWIIYWCARQKATLHKKCKFQHAHLRQFFLHFGRSACFGNPENLSLDGFCMKRAG